MGIFNFGPSKQVLKQQILELQSKNSSIAVDLSELQSTNNSLNEKLDSTKYENEDLKNKLSHFQISKDELRCVNLKDEIEILSKKRQDFVNDMASKRSTLRNLEDELENKTKEYDEKINISEFRFKELNDKYNIELEKLNNLPKKKAKLNQAFKAIEYAINEYLNIDFEYNHLKIRKEDIDLINNLVPSASIKLHSMDIKDLKKSLKLNQELIEETLHKYEGRYTTKANIAIYKLMVIALKAELQNVLYNLKFETIEESLDIIREITKKYLIIASEGNQSIAPTISKFIGEIEYLFLESVKIEYQYYVKKEQQRAEQAAIREQMRQDAAEKKALEMQRKKVEAEEEKYINEIMKIKEQLQSSDYDKSEQLELRIKELQEQLSLVESKKEDIVSRQNGKAGNVYVISNLGSFGNDIFKIGMTRRLDPFERIKELGSASVPFTFDVHSFIFSDDAVTLEQKLHSILDNKRVNKINLRKEFFKVSIDELENLVYEIDPSAEFNKTMLAEEYNQSTSFAAQSN